MCDGTGKTRTKHSTKCEIKETIILCLVYLLQHNIGGKAHVSCSLTTPTKATEENVLQIEL